MASPAQVKVALLDAIGAPEKISVDGPFVIEGKRSFFVSAGRYILSAEKNGGVVLASCAQNIKPLLVHEQNLRLHAAGSDGIIIGGSANIERKFDVHPDAHQARFGPRRYKGEIIISAEPVSTGQKNDFTQSRVTYNREKNSRSSNYALSLINVVSRREYLASVVSSEMPVGAPLEALKAQSVLANTQIARLSSSQTIEDSTQVQSYRGAPISRPEVYVAVDQTMDQILEFGHKPVQAFFHSTCAGMTSKPSDIFGGKQLLPYLINVRCEDCRRSPFWETTEVSIPQSKFETVFGGKLPVVTACDLAGRPTEVSYQYSGKPLLTNGYQFWLRLGQAFGWGKAPGTKFSLSEHDREVFIKSVGAGHGVGMCQWGAIGMARRGKSYAKILAFYFPGTEVRGGTAPRQRS